MVKKTELPDNEELSLSPSKVTDTIDTGRKLKTAIPKKAAPAKKKIEKPKPEKKASKVKVVKLTKIKIKKKSIPEPVLKAVSITPNGINTVRTSETTDWELTEYDKVKLEKALSKNLIPIDITPLKVTLVKEPVIKKDEEENQILLAIELHLSLKKVWELWTSPKHIKKWFSASEYWSTVQVENDLLEGGQFLFSLKSQDGEEVSEFKGTYTEVIAPTLITFLTEDNLKVMVNLAEVSPKQVKLNLSFEPDDLNSVTIQRRAWQTILNNFKEYAEKK